MSDKDLRLLCTLDRLKSLIRNTRRDGKFTISKTYEDYYNTIIETPKIKKVITTNKYNTKI